MSSTARVEEHTATLEEGGVRLHLTVVDTPGYGDAVDNSGCWEPIVTYLDRNNNNNGCLLMENPCKIKY